MRLSRWARLLWSCPLYAICIFSRMSTTKVLEPSELVEAADSMGYTFRVDEEIEKQIELARITAINYKLVEKSISYICYYYKRNYNNILGNFFYIIAIYVSSTQFSFFLCQQVFYSFCCRQL